MKPSSLLIVPVILAIAAPGDGHAQDAPSRPGSNVESGGARDKALGADMEANLRKAGFTNLQIMPNSILVRATDKDGHPVAMLLHPGSMTEVVTLDPHSGSAASGDGRKRPLTGSGAFATVLPSERLASIIIGLKLRDRSGKDLATIEDLAIDHDGVQAYILKVGGVLGLGERYVAVSPSAVDLTQDRDANSYAASSTLTKTQLKDAPDFVYKGPFKANRD